jgi:hypothetical protein
MQQPHHIVEILHQVYIPILYHTKKSIRIIILVLSPRTSPIHHSVRLLDDIVVIYRSMDAQYWSRRIQHSISSRHRHKSISSKKIRMISLLCIAILDIVASIHRHPSPRLHRIGEAIVSSRYPRVSIVDHQTTSSLVHLLLLLSQDSPSLYPHSEG